MLQTVDIYIGTSLHGPARGTGKVMYIMRAKLPSGKDHESAPEAGEYDDTTEGRLVLCSIRDALQRLNYACRVVVHTECNYVAAAITQHWPERWKVSGWRNSHGEEVKDAILWEMILQETKESGHELEAEAGKHEYSGWIAWQLPLAQTYKDTFWRQPKNQP